MSDYRRRRFITDLLFVGGALLAAAGLASTGQAQNQTPSDSPSPRPATPTPRASNTERPMPGEPVAIPATPSPRNYPPAGAPMPPVNGPKPVVTPKCVKKPQR